MKSMYKIMPAFCSIIALSSFPLSSWAQNAPSAQTGAYDTIRYVLAGFAFLLLLVIIALGYAIKASLDIRKKQLMKNKHASKLASLALLFAATGSSLSSWAQDAAEEAAPAPKGFWGNLFATAPNDMLITILVILIEIAVIFVLVRVQVRLLREKKATVATEQALQGGFWARLLENLGANKVTDDVSDLDLEHDYDGIRELDNNIPKWWQFAFAGTVVFAVVYLFRMFITGSLPDQLTELEKAERVAAIKMAEYLKNSANNVDEHTVEMLDAAGIAIGADLYAKNCVACHGAAGEGTIGPNLTDEYWLHKGGIKDIFYSIKYGWPEKGMKSWKDDFSPMQIAQLSSYVKSLAGTNPPNAKEAEGDLYTEEVGAEEGAEAPVAEDAAESATAEI